jgi:hypothetical protein
LCLTEFHPLASLWDLTFDWKGMLHVKDCGSEIWVEEASMDADFERQGKKIHSHWTSKFFPLWPKLSNHHFEFKFCVACSCITLNTVLGATGSPWVSWRSGKSMENQRKLVSALSRLALARGTRPGELDSKACGVLRKPGGVLRSAGGVLRGAAGNLRGAAGNLRGAAGTCGSLQQGAATPWEILFKPW